MQSKESRPFAPTLNVGRNASLAPKAKIHKILWGMTDPEVAIKMSLGPLGELEHGTQSAELGPSHKSGLCKTCKNDAFNCPIHYADIQLEFPCYDYQYMPDVMAILWSKCFYCHRVLIAKNDPRRDAIMAESDPEKRKRMCEAIGQSIRYCDEHYVTSKQNKTANIFNPNNSTTKSYMNSSVTITDMTEKHIADHGCGQEQPVWVWNKSDPLKIRCFIRVLKSKDKIKNESKTKSSSSSSSSCSKNKDKKDNDNDNTKTKGKTKSKKKVSFDENNNEFTNENLNMSKSIDQNINNKRTDDNIEEFDDSIPHEEDNEEDEDEEQDDKRLGERRCEDNEYNDDDEYNDEYNNNNKISDTQDIDIEAEEVEADDVDIDVADDSNINISVSGDNEEDIPDLESFRDIENDKENDIDIDIDNDNVKDKETTSSSSSSSKSRSKSIRGKITPKSNFFLKEIPFTSWMAYENLKNTTKDDAILFGFNPPISNYDVDGYPVDVPVVLSSQEQILKQEQEQNQSSSYTPNIIPITQSYSSPVWCFRLVHLFPKPCSVTFKDMAKRFADLVRDNKTLGNLKRAYHAFIEKKKKLKKGLLTEEDLNVDGIDLLEINKDDNDGKSISNNNNNNNNNDIGNDDNDINDNDLLLYNNPTDTWLPETIALGKRGKDNRDKKDHKNQLYDTKDIHHIAEKLGIITRRRPWECPLDYSLINGQFYQIIERLNYHSAIIYRSNIPKPPQYNQRVKFEKCITNMMTGKEGMPRQLLTAKRVDFSCRLVIDPDPNMDINQVGVPLTIAQDQLYQIPVTSFNIHMLTEKYVHKDTYPRALFIDKINGTKLSLKDMSLPDLMSITLDIGDVVHRHMVNDDDLLVNRQPSLDCLSIMSLKVVILPEDDPVFKVHVALMGALAGDYDGDAAAGYALQTVGALIESRDIMASELQAATPQSGGIIINAFLDAVLGNALATQNLTVFTLSQVTKCLSECRYMGNMRFAKPCISEITRFNQGGDDCDDCDTDENQNQNGDIISNWWSGKQIISEKLPDISMNSNNNKYSPSIVIPYNEKSDNDFVCNNTFILRDGNLLSGVLNGQRISELILTIYHQKGKRESIKVLGELYRLSNAILKVIGVSMNIRDTLAQCKPEMEKIKKNTIAAIEEDVNLQENKLDHPTIAREKEKVVCKILEDLRSKLGEMIKLEDENLDNPFFNNLREMISSGSKKAELNRIAQTATVGQLYQEGKRFNLLYNERSIPFFPKGSNILKQKGYANESLIDGLSVESFVLYSNAGRIQMVISCVNPADTGYFERLMVKMAETVTTTHTGVSCDGSLNIINWSFSSNQADIRSMTFQPLPTLLMDNNTLTKECSSVDIIDWKQYITDEAWIKMESQNSKVEITKLLQEEYNQIQQDRDIIRKLRQTFGNDEIQTMLRICVQVTGVINQLYSSLLYGKTDLTPTFVCKTIKKFVAHLYSDPRVSVSRNYDLESILRYYFCCKVVIIRQRMTKAIFVRILTEISNQYICHIISPGISVGALAGQHIGQPATQMTLSTFSSNAEGNRNSEVVGTIKSCFDVSDKNNDPVMSIWVKPEFEHMVFQLKNDIVVKYLIDITKKEPISGRSFTIISEPDIKTSIIKEHQETVEEYFALCHPSDYKSLCPTVVCFEICRNLAAQVSLTLRRILVILNGMKYDNTDGHVWIGVDTGTTWILRLYMNKKSQLYKRFKTEYYPSMDPCIQVDPNYWIMESFANTISKKTVVRGIKGIHNGYIITQETTVSLNGNLVTIPRVIISTTGSNYQEIMKLPWVDRSQTSCNSAWDVQHVLGIDAAAMSMARRAERRFHLSGITVDKAYPYTIIKTMTHRGYLMSMRRSGVNRQNDYGPLPKQALEESMITCKRAAIRCEIDHLRGPTENIITGGMAIQGTGYLNPLDLNPPEDIDIADHNMKQLMSRQLPQLTIQALDAYTRNGIKDTTNQLQRKGLIKVSEPFKHISAYNEKEMIIINDQFEMIETDMDCITQLSSVSSSSSSLAEAVLSSTTSQNNSNKKNSQDSDEIDGSKLLLLPVEKNTNTRQIKKQELIDHRQAQRKIQISHIQEKLHPGELEHETKTQVDDFFGDIIQKCQAFAEKIKAENGSTVSKKVTAQQQANEIRLKTFKDIDNINFIDEPSIETTKKKLIKILTKQTQHSNKRKRSLDDDDEYEDKDTANNNNNNSKDCKENAIVKKKVKPNSKKKHNNSADDYVIEDYCDIQDMKTKKALNKKRAKRQKKDVAARLLIID